jgi:acid phosphatase type 7
MSASLLVGLVLTFAKSDASELQLTVTLASAATASIDLEAAGRPLESRGHDRPATRHLFAAIPTPSTEPLTYVLRVAGEPPRRETIRPLFTEPLFVALYGDSRDGPGPHRTLVEAIDRAGPQLVIHTGDLVHQAGDRVGWVNHLSASLPLSSRVPVILSLGNHELWQPWDRPPSERLDAIAEILAEIPPPEDLLARKLGVGPQTFHVRVGKHLFVSIDSNAPIGAGSPQLRFLEAVLDEGGYDTSFVSLHHGPISSGPHGGHPDGAALIALAEKKGVTAILSGHDHLYERIAQKNVSYVISGGGGAPLYERRALTLGSLAFASSYNWVSLVLEGPRARLQAKSLEGVVLDHGELPVGVDVAAEDRRVLLGPALGAAVLLAVLLFGLARLALARGPGSR